MKIVLIVLAVAAVIVALLFAADGLPELQGQRMNWKQMLQITGGGVMLVGLFGGRGAHPSSKVFIVGAVVFLSTFLTWKPKRDS